MRRPFARSTRSIVRSTRPRLQTSANRACEGHDLDERELEPADHLLAWRDTSVCYCHFADDDEIARVTACPRLSALSTFDADGKTGDSNRYVVLERLRVDAT